MTAFHGFIGPSYTVASPGADCERLINWYPVKMESSAAKSAFFYEPAPGMTPVLTLPESPVRGLFSVLDRLYAVAGTKLYRISPDWSAVEQSATPLGSASSGASINSIVSFASNGDAGGQVFVASGLKAHYLTLDGSFPTTDLGLPVDGCGFLSGRVLALDRSSSTVYVSDLEDAGTFNPANIIQRSSAPDRWQAIIVVNGDIWLLGDQTSDVWYDAGLAPVPFAFKALVECGIAAPNAVAKFDNAPCWLSQTEQGAYTVVRAVNGYGPPLRISTHAVEYAIASYGDVSDAVAFAYEDQGHAFFVLTFPSAGATWVYDGSTQIWHERAYWNRTSGVWEAYRPWCHAWAFGKHLVGDRQSGTIYALSPTAFTDVDGNGIRRLRRAPHLVNEQRWIFYSRLQLDLDMGIGLVSGQGSDPQVMLRWSDDGGRTFGNEHRGSAGAQGAYRQRVIWNRLGRSRDRVFEVSTSDPVPYRLSGAYLQFDSSES